VGLDALSLLSSRARALKPYVPGRPLAELERRLGRPAVELSGNENALPPSKAVREAIARAAAHAHRYPDGGGFALRERLAREFALTPDHVALGGGSNELIELLCHAFLDPGDEVVYSHPTFLMYAVSVTLLGGVPVPVPGRNLGLEHDLEAMLAAIGPRTRMVIVCNPNNPTGALVPRDAFFDFVRRVPERVVVLSDEAYHEYVEDPAYPRSLDLLAEPRPFYSLRTFSKIHSLAGLRVGYAIARPEWARALDRVRLPFNVSAVAQAAAIAALDDPAHVAESRDVSRRGKARLLAELPRLGVVAHPSHANFVLADLGRDSRPVCEALAERGVLVRGLVAFGLAPQFVRISTGTDAEITQLVTALAAVLAAPARGER
jgi:histidinol-phosphate aminotransferase